MQKRNSIIFFISFLLMISLISAYGSYNSFSLSNFLNDLDSSTIFLGGLFIVLFAVLNFSLSRVFKDANGIPNKPVVTLISIVISVMAVYGINKTGFDLESFFFDLGLSGDILSILVPILVLGAVLWIITKYGAGMALSALGAGITLITISTDWVYEKGVAITIGLVLLGIGLYLYSKKRKAQTNP